MRVYTYLTTHTQRFHHCRKSHGMGRHIVSHEALNYLKVVFVCLFVWMSQKNTLDTQLRKTESKTVQVICRVGSCVNDGILFYSSVNLAWFSENELSHSDNEKRDFFFFFLRGSWSGTLTRPICGKTLKETGTINPMTRIVQESFRVHSDHGFCRKNWVL